MHLPIDLFCTADYIFRWNSAVIVDLFIVSLWKGFVDYDACVSGVIVIYFSFGAWITVVIDQKVNSWFLFG